MYFQVVTVAHSLDRPQEALGDVALSPVFRRVSARCPVLHLFGYLHIPLSDVALRASSSAVPVSSTEVGGERVPLATLLEVQPHGASPTAAPQPHLLSPSPAATAVHHRPSAASSSPQRASRSVHVVEPVTLRKEATADAQKDVHASGCAHDSAAASANSPRSSAVLRSRYTQRRACLHVHGVYPSLLLPQYDRNVSAEQLAAQLETVVVRVLSRQGMVIPGQQLVHDVRVVHRYNVYGYRPHPYAFYQVELIDPSMHQRVVDILQNTREVGGRQWQLYDAHMKYHTQFMVHWRINGVAPFVLPVQRCHVRLPTAVELHGVQQSSSSCSSHSQPEDEGVLPAKAPHASGKTPNQTHAATTTTNAAAAAAAASSSAQSSVRSCYTGLPFLRFWRSDELGRSTTAEVELDVCARDLHEGGEADDDDPTSSRLPAKSTASSTVAAGDNLSYTRRTIRRYFREHGVPDALRVADTIAMERHLQATVGSLRYGSVAQLQRADPTVRWMRHRMLDYLAQRRAAAAAAVAAASVASPQSLPWKSEGGEVKEGLPATTATTHASSFADGGAEQTVSSQQQREQRAIRVQMVAAYSKTSSGRGGVGHQRSSRRRGSGGETAVPDPLPTFAQLLDRAGASKAAAAGISPLPPLQEVERVTGDARYIGFSSDSLQLSLSQEASTQLSPQQSSQADQLAAGKSWMAGVSDEGVQTALLASTQDLMAALAAASSASLPAVQSSHIDGEEDYKEESEAKNSPLVPSSREREVAVSPSHSSGTAAPPTVAEVDRGVAESAEGGRQRVASSSPCSSWSSWSSWSSDSATASPTDRTAAASPQRTPAPSALAASDREEDVLQCDGPTQRLEQYAADVPAGHSPTPSPRGEDDVFFSHEDASGAEEEREARATRKRLRFSSPAPLQSCCSPTADSTHDVAVGTCVAFVRVRSSDLSASSRPPLCEVLAVARVAAVALDTISLQWFLSLCETHLAADEGALVRRGAWRLLARCTRVLPAAAAPIRLGEMVLGNVVDVVPASVLQEKKGMSVAYSVADCVPTQRLTVGGAAESNRLTFGFEAASEEKSAQVETGESAAAVRVWPVHCCVDAAAYTSPTSSAEKKMVGGQPSQSTPTGALVLRVLCRYQYGIEARVLTAATADLFAPVSSGERVSSPSFYEPRTRSHTATTRVAAASAKGSAKNSAHVVPTRRRSVRALFTQPERLSIPEERKTTVDGADVSSLSSSSSSLFGDTSVENSNSNTRADGAVRLSTTVPSNAGGEGEGEDTLLFSSSSSSRGSRSGSSPPGDMDDEARAVRRGRVDVLGAVATSSNSAITSQPQHLQPHHCLVSTSAMPVQSFTVGATHVCRGVSEAITHHMGQHWQGPKQQWQQRYPSTLLVQDEPEDEKREEHVIDSLASTAQQPVAFTVRDASLCAASLSTSSSSSSSASSASPSQASSVEAVGVVTASQRAFLQLFHTSGASAALHGTVLQKGGSLGPSVDGVPRYFRVTACAATSEGGKSLEKPESPVRGGSALASGSIKAPLSRSPQRAAGQNVSMRVSAVTWPYMAEGAAAAEEDTSKDIKIGQLRYERVEEAEERKDVAEHAASPTATTATTTAGRAPAAAPADTKTHAKEGTARSASTIAGLSRSVTQQPQHYLQCVLRVQYIEVLLDRKPGEALVSTSAVLAVGLGQATTAAQSPAAVRIFCVAPGQKTARSSGQRGLPPQAFSLSGLCASVQVVALSDEAALLLRVRDEILAYDPDVLLSWEGYKYGLGFLALRYRAVLHRSLAADLSRLLQHHGHLQRKPVSAAAPPPQRVGEEKEGKQQQQQQQPQAPAVPAALSQSSPSSGPEDLCDGEVDEDSGGSQHDSRSAALKSSAAAAASAAYSKRFGATVHITGRICTSLGKDLRKNVKLPSYALPMVHREVFGQPLPYFTDTYLAELFHATEDPGERHAALRYLAVRVVAPHRIASSLNWFTRLLEFSRMYGILMEEVLTRGSQFRVEATLLRLAHPLRYAMLSPSQAQVHRQPRIECIPLVMQPRANFYGKDDPVVVLDFRSLYPSIIIAYNLCYSTCLGMVQPTAQGRLGVLTNFAQRDSLLAELLPDDGAQHEGVVFTPNGAMFVSPGTCVGLVPRMVQAVLDTRFEVQASLRHIAVPTGDVTMQQRLDEQQLALKMLANVTYGYTAASFTGRMPCVDLAEAIVSLGRQTLERAVALIHSTPAWQAEVIYGDTDSLFVRLHGRTVQEAFVVGQAMADAVTQSNPSPVRLQFEKVLSPCLLLVKKRYAGYMWSSPHQTTPTFLAKGIEVVRRDQCPATAQMAHKMLRMLFDGCPAADLRTAYYAAVTKLQAGAVNPLSCIFRRAVKLGRYGHSSDGHLPLAARLALKQMEKDVTETPYWGELLPYVVVRSTHSIDTLSDQVLHPAHLLCVGDTHRLDADYYIARNINSSLDRMFYLVGISFSQWYQSMPRRRTAHAALLTLPTFMKAQGQQSPIPQRSRHLSLPPRKLVASVMSQAVRTLDRASAIAVEMQRLAREAADPRWMAAGGGGARLTAAEEVISDEEPPEQEGPSQGKKDSAAAEPGTSPHVVEDLTRPTAHDFVDVEQLMVTQPRHSTAAANTAQNTRARQLSFPQRYRGRGRGGRGGRAGAAAAAGTHAGITLDSYYPRTLCVVCEREAVSLDEVRHQREVLKSIDADRHHTTPGTAAGPPLLVPPICTHCWGDPGALYLHVQERCRSLGHELHSLHALCASCIGSGGDWGAATQAGYATAQVDMEDMDAFSAALLRASRDGGGGGGAAVGSVPRHLVTAVRLSPAGVPHGCASIDCGVGFEKKWVTEQWEQWRAVQRFLRDIL